MKRVIQALSLASLMFFASEGRAEISLYSEKFGASFTNEYYKPGTLLCDTGVVNGSWGRVVEGTAVAAEDTVHQKKYMDLTADDGLFFTPSSISEKRTCSDLVSIRTTAYEDLSQLPYPTGARAAFAIHAPEGGTANYMGWVCSQNCWTNLYPASGSADIALEEWREVMVRFHRIGNAKDGYVQYWLKRSDDDGLVPLKTADGVSWIRTGAELDSEKYGKVEFSGSGDLEWISGREPNRGLIVGVGSWYDFLFDESIYNQSTGSSWDNVSARTRSDALRSYVINVDKGGEPVTYNTSRTHSLKNVEVTELEVQFTGANDDESIPDDACARIRLVELPDETCRFACLADGQWKTNMNWAVSAAAKYTVEISLLNTVDGEKFVSYRYKEGYGLEGGAYRDLFLNEPMLPKASGKTLSIDFEGSGIVHDIRGKDRPK